VGAVSVVGEAAAYQPIVANPHLGAMLQVTPHLLPEGKTAVLDVQSVVAHRVHPPETVPFLSGASGGGKGNAGANAGGAAPGISITLDRVNVVAQQLATTLRVSLGKPVLVGGLTLEPGSGEQQPGASQQLYLFVEVTAD
jgi:hypothetical protein